MPARARSTDAFASCSKGLLWSASARASVMVSEVAGSGAEGTDCVTDDASASGADDEAWICPIASRAEICMRRIRTKGIRTRGGMHVAFQPNADHLQGPKNTLRTYSYSGRRKMSHLGQCWTVNKTNCLIRDGLRVAEERRR